MEALGARIGHVHIINANVFDPSVEAENNRLFRLANALHVETRPDVIESQLLFKSGERFSARLIRESERILRSNQYLHDARINPVRFENGTVDIEVRTRDVWTLKPGISLGRSGGENSTSFEFEESNLLGFGKEVELAYENDVDRTTLRARYYDPHLLGTWNRLGVAYEDNSDGSLRELLFSRPFFSLDTRNAYGMSVLDWTRIDPRYNLGERVDEFSHDEEEIDLTYGWSRGLSDGWVSRIIAGVRYESDRFSATDHELSAAVLPENRRLAYPYVEWEILEDQYEERRNQDQIGRTEDVYTGTFMRARLGYASTVYGSDRDALVMAVAAGTSLEYLERKHTILLRAESEGRLEGGQLRDGVIEASARYYWRTRPKQLFYASLSGAAAKNLDAEEQLLLGGDTGLRGYPLRYQDGSAQALLTLEHRVFTDLYLFRLFHVGGAVFFDAGRTWGNGNGGSASEGVLKDVGIGLRLGSSRSAFGNVIHLDLAFPLDRNNDIDGMQFLIETKTSF
jgi:hypothetical protein